MTYPYKLRETRADPRREDEYYILTCAYCEQPTKHKHLRDRLFPYSDGGKAIDHLYKCSECGSARRWGLSDTRKMGAIEVKELEAEPTEV